MNPHPNDTPFTVPILPQRLCLPSSLQDLIEQQGHVTRRSGASVGGWKLLHREGYLDELQESLGPP